jgi:hypothetical protein
MNGKTSLSVYVVAAFGGVESAVLIREIRSQMVFAAAMRAGFYVIPGDGCMAQSK